MILYQGVFLQSGIRRTVCSLCFYIPSLSLMLPSMDAWLHSKPGNDFALLQSMNELPNREQAQE